MHYVNGGSGDCYQALDRHWPASSRQWARSIVARDRNIPPTRTSPHRPRLLAAAPSASTLAASKLRRLARSGLTLT